MKHNFYKTILMIVVILTSSCAYYSKPIGKEHSLGPLNNLTKGEEVNVLLNVYYNWSGDGQYASIRIKAAVSQAMSARDVRINWFADGDELPNNYEQWFIVVDNGVEVENRSLSPLSLITSIIGVPTLTVIPFKGPDYKVYVKFNHFVDKNLIGSEIYSTTISYFVGLSGIFFSEQGGLENELAKIVANTVEKSWSSTL